MPSAPLKDGVVARLERRFVWNFSAVMFTIALVLMMFEAISRVALSHSYFWVEELSRYLILWAFFLTLGLAGRQGQHIRLNLVVDMVPAPVRTALNIVASLGGVTFCVILGYGLIKQIERLHASGIRTESTLDWPMWAVVSVLVAGTVLYALYYLECLLLCLKGIDPFAQGEEEAFEAETGTPQ